MKGYILCIKYNMRIQVWYDTFRREQLDAKQGHINTAVYLHRLQLSKED